jgi:hypothetical protein
MEELYEMYGNTHYKSGWKPWPRKTAQAFLLHIRTLQRLKREYGPGENGGDEQGGRRI